jgi:hypothetical protein
MQINSMGLSPRQAVQSFMIDQLAGLYREVKTYSTLNGHHLSRSEQNESLRAIAIQHNDILERSSLDGIELDMPERELTNA